MNTKERQCVDKLWLSQLEPQWLNKNDCIVIIYDWGLNELQCPVKHLFLTTYSFFLGLNLVESYPYETVQRDYNYVRLASISAGKFTNLHYLSSYSKRLYFSTGFVFYQDYDITPKLFCCEHSQHKHHSHPRLSWNNRIQPSHCILMDASATLLP